MSARAGKGFFHPNQAACRCYPEDVEVSTWANVMPNKQSLLCLLCVPVALALVGCEFEPRITSVHAERVGDHEVIEVKVPSSDAATIRNRQLYFSVVVASCDGESEKFPMEPYIDGERAAEFKFATAGNDVRILSRMPVKLFQEYGEPCVALQGGGYLTGKLKSATVPIN